MLGGAAAAWPLAAGSQQQAMPVIEQTLANVCAASRESINRCLGGWQRRGIGETEKRTIRKLLDEELAEQNG